MVVMITKQKKKKRLRELTLRIEENDLILDRLAWIEYNRKDLPTRNAALREAVEHWVKAMETKYGLDPQAVLNRKRL